MLLLELLLDNALHLKESANLIGIKHRRQLINIFHPDALSALLHFHLALGNGRRIAAGARLDGALAAGPKLWFLEFCEPF